MKFHHPTPKGHPTPETGSFEPTSGLAEAALYTEGRAISPIIAAALCIKPHSLLTHRQAEKVALFKSTSPDFGKMRQLAMRLGGILRGNDTDKLYICLHHAQQSGVFGMRRFVRTLRQDLAAVRNAITEACSNGQAEGQTGRLKMLKRAMYGRASNELLRARILPLES